MNTLLLMLIFVLPSGRDTRQCDLREVNHVHDGATGCVRFTQLIAWEWLPDYCVYRAQDWRIVREWHVTGQCVAFRETDEMRLVRFRIMRETWTDRDRELDDRLMFPETKRVKVFP